MMLKLFAVWIMGFRVRIVFAAVMLAFLLLYLAIFYVCSKVNSLHLHKFVICLHAIGYGKLLEKITDRVGR
jgi:hypothetical protein